MITSLASAYPVRLLCAVLDIAPSSYYYQPQAGDELEMLAAIEGSDDE